MTIQIEGKNAFDVIKKGCPLNLNNFKTNMCANTVFNGVTITIDLLDEDKNIFNLMAYRSFADSFYHTITDASLEYGYKAE
jgi:sarcosine oxidase subunit gamma